MIQDHEVEKLYTDTEVNGHSIDHSQQADLISKKENVFDNIHIPNKQVFNFDIPPFKAGFKRNQQSLNADDSDEFEEISFIKLQKHIEATHPICPVKKTSYSIRDSVTVNKLSSKLMDVCNTYELKEWCRAPMKVMRRKLGGNKDREVFVKPSTLDHLPDSESDSEGEESDGGLNEVTMNLG